MLATGRALCPSACFLDDLVESVTDYEVSLLDVPYTISFRLLADSADL